MDKLDFKQLEETLTRVFRINFGYFAIIILIGMVINWMFIPENTELEIYTDRQTGCQYVSKPGSSFLVSRNDEYGKQLCQEGFLRE